MGLAHHLSNGEEKKKGRRGGKLPLLPNDSREWVRKRGSPSYLKGGGKGKPYPDRRRKISYFSSWKKNRRGKCPHPRGERGGEKGHLCASYYRPRLVPTLTSKGSPREKKDPLSATYTGREERRFFSRDESLLAKARRGKMSAITWKDLTIPA